MDLEMFLEGIPQFPESRKITLADRPVIEKLFAEYPSEISERTFGSVYVWRNYEDRSRISQLDGHLIISWRREKFGSILLTPVGGEPAKLIGALSELGSGAQLTFNGIFGIVDPLASQLKEAGLSPIPLRDEWDYVYRTNDLIVLEGPKYHTQRKEMKKATSEFELVYESMTTARQKDCLELEETWCDLKHCTLGKLSAAEDGALREAVANLDEIGFFGGVILLRDNVQALTIGERLNSNTAVVHFEKANPAIRGLYQVINQQFCEHALRDFEFVNREQDVGEPGLRRAKEGYHPYHFVEKYMLPFR
ncbi:MAG: DUF2156 domain-containing protein [Candidatus Thermoplasmatota archaeon]|nr:DUF2156 domain-containing protein [Candidatus Thermoplasmatota archaeon]MBU1914875.1 DUF2156 domain-containing protein [Candidatus Thermoplasmatota archaeon]